MLSVLAATSLQNLVAVLRVTSFVAHDVARFRDRLDRLGLLCLRRQGHRDQGRRVLLCLRRQGHLCLDRQNLIHDLGRRHLCEFHLARRGLHLDLTGVADLPCPPAHDQGPRPEFVRCARLSHQWDDLEFD